MHRRAPATSSHYWTLIVSIQGGVMASFSRRNRLIYGLELTGLGLTGLELTGLGLTGLGLTGLGLTGLGLTGVV
ncbi:hypothetical protein [Acidithrix sp. C25]|uniref:hypothetical protein n=1 Tax=Acidithrix sp. C25 TaxID=1671482 RepID=UPI00191B91FF|nr:hypothetical protein [Acidithrix sp. C25]